MLLLNFTIFVHALPRPPSQGPDVVHAVPREAVAAAAIFGGDGHHQALRRPLHHADAPAKHHVRQRQTPSVVFGAERLHVPFVCGQV